MEGLIDDMAAPNTQVAVQVVDMQQVVVVVEVVDGLVAAASTVPVS